MQDSIAGFVGGAIAGTLGGITILGMPLQLNTGNVYADFAMEYAIKIIGTIIVGAVGGLTGMATKDLYNHFKRKFKNKKDG